VCGRINLTSAPHVLAEKFYLDMVPELTPRYNIAPSQPVAAVTPNPLSPGRLLRWFRWGLEPAGRNAGGGAPKPINARSETVRGKPTFREAFAHRRCLIPVNGFYEWQKAPGGSRPWLFHRPAGAVFALAGVWEPGPDDSATGTCAILTTRANRVMRPIHHRMPVILPEGDWKTWLDLVPDRLDDLEALLQPALADALRAHPVDRRVGDPRWDDPQCLEPVPDEGNDQLDLFG
jgi:putative SOS response-associated peptidase YedK